MRPIIKYPGAKWAIADWVVARLPAHSAYLEPYFGSGAVFFTKDRAPYETINDIDDDIVNLYRVIREDADRLAALLEITPWARAEYDRSCDISDEPIERARRFVTHTWQSFGRGIPGVETGWKTKASEYTLRRWAHLPDDICRTVERLRGVRIEKRPGIDLIRAHCDPRVLIYADPPYPSALRRRFYPHEMTDADHVALLDALDAHPGPVALSGYHCPLYDARLAHWHAHEIHVTVEHGETRIEVLWLNRESFGPIFDTAPIAS